eukprot:m.104030 g.104030  ORF g.104030 m.104030 type:complete len:457 (-) comp15737_c0_seq2:555-1925(-)
MSSSSLSEIWEGYLIKSPPLKTPTGSSMKSWRKRFFVIHAPPFPQETVIRYYADQEAHRSAVEPKGEIPLSQITAVKAVAGHSRHANMFQIETQTRMFFLSAPTVEEMHKWIYSIRKLLKQSYDPSLPDNGTGKPLLLIPTGAASASDSAAVPKVRRDVYQRTDFTHIPTSVRHAVHQAASSSAHPPAHTSSIRAGLPHAPAGHQASAHHRTPSNDHTNKPWFYGFMNRDAAEAELFQMVRGTTDSRFIVRESMKEPGVFALSWAQGGKVTHTKIIMQDGFYVFDVAQSVLQEFKGRTLSELIESREFQIYLASVEESHRQLVGRPPPVAGAPPPRPAGASSSSGAGSSSNNSPRGLPRHHQSYQYDPAELEPEMIEKFRQSLSASAKPRTAPPAAAGEGEGYITVKERSDSLCASSEDEFDESLAAAVLPKANPASAQRARAETGDYVDVKSGEW